MRRRPRSLALLAALLAGAGCAGTPARELDVQAHRGGLGLVVENTLPAFANALELGVNTLELDVAITEDGAAVVTHDRKVSAAKCRDTRPARPGDPEFPYVGRLVATLTTDQVRTLDCGSLRNPAHPGQRLVPGTPMPLLTEVFALVDRYRAGDVTLNIETKVEAAAPDETASRERFVQVVVAAVGQAGKARQVTIQSFDWGVLTRLAEVAPELRRVALTNGAQFLQPGRPGASPWLGGLDVDDFLVDGRSLQQALVAAARTLGVDTLSPVHGDPQGGSVDDPGYRAFTTPELVTAAHEAGITVVPWTVDDPATMRRLIRAGVDGIITDRPDLLRKVLQEEGLPLPPALSLP